MRPLLARSWRPFLAITIMLATIGVFVYYFAKHPAVRQELRHTSPEVLLAIFGLYLLSIVALALITIATLRLCKVRLPTIEATLLTAYTAVINFFGPLQSGPAFRAIYLKKKHGLKLKDYTVATLAYYFFYGSFSGLFLLSGLLKWWLVPLIAAGGLVVLLVWRSGLLAKRLQGLDLRGWYYLALATLLQVSIIALIYYTELRSVAPSTHFSQAIIYTGAANLALFVSITPGAIGFRESFLVFSRHLHHVSNSTIIAANILDRAMYVIVLLVLAVFIFATHASRQLAVTPAESQEK